MKTGNNHLLQKVTFEINLARQDGAFEIQNRISNAFRSGVIKELEKIFDQKSIPGVVVSIDKIEMDLGNLNSANLEEDIVAAFEREMNNFLATLNEEITRVETTTFTKSKKVNVRWSVPGNPHFEAEVTLAPDAISHFERVLQLLEFGVLPESGSSSHPQKISALINSVLAHNAEQLAQFIRANGQGKPHILQRLALNLTREQLQYVAALLGCPFSGQLLTFIRDLEKFFAGRKLVISEVNIPGSIRFATLEQFIWWLVLVKFSGTDSIEPMNGGGQTQSSLHSLATAPVKLVSEIIFVVDRLSQRSLFTSNGLKNGKQELAERVGKETQLSETVEKGIELVRTLLIARQRENKNRIPDATIEPAYPSEKSMFSDSASLLHNSLFTIPDKKEPVVPQILNTGEPIPGADTGIYINNAGLIILGPYLKPFFNRLGLLNGSDFASTESAWKAVHLLQHACGFVQESGREGWSEQELFFNKLLCGIDISEPVPEVMEMSSEELEELDGLLNSVLQNWTIMQRSSIFALQSTFLQKKGRLSISGKNWDMIVERDSAVEILIDKLPWSISIIKLPWNDYTINTQW
jgi:hypothetical protein